MRRGINSFILLKPFTDPSFIILPASLSYALGNLPLWFNFEAVFSPALVDTQFLKRRFLFKSCMQMLYTSYTYMLSESVKNFLVNFRFYFSSGLICHLLSLTISSHQTMFHLLCKRTSLLQSGACFFFFN